MSASPRLVRIALLINGLSALLTIAVFLGLAPLIPHGPADIPPVDRLVHALHLALLPAGLVLAQVFGTAGARAAAGALNPIDDDESRLYRKSQRALSNTIEQTLVFLPGFLALATLVPGPQYGFLELVMGLYIGGRLLFWVGYLLHPMARAPGMAATLVVNGAVLGADVYWLLTG